MLHGTRSRRYYISNGWRNVVVEDAAKLVVSGDDPTHPWKMSLRGSWELPKNLLVGAISKKGQNNKSIPICCLSRAVPHDLVHNHDLKRL